MPLGSASATSSLFRRTDVRLGLAVLVVIAAGGLFIVKWDPYYRKALLVSIKHSLGASPIFQRGLVTPPPSFAAALGYAKSYFNAVWQAWILGLLLAATIETLLPRAWLARTLGSASHRSSLLGGVLALPGMM